MSALRSLADIVECTRDIGFVPESVRIPTDFAGDGRDTANAVLFLASDEARFITGTAIVVDGGMSVRCG
jgi:NAD(P)-dependent dehydrogenase (short-subunit alcohol dehydrogenase family)